MSDERPPLHSHRRRDPSPEELERVRVMLAEGASIKAIGRALGCGDGRAKRIATGLEVMAQAERLRLTQHVPAQLDEMLRATTATMQLVQEMRGRLSAVEQQMSKMNRTVRIQVVKIARQRETLREVRERERDLRRMMRERGLPVD